MEQLEYYFVTKAPFQLPVSAKEWLVKFGPWLTLIGMLILLPVMLALFGLDAYLSSFGGYYASSWTLVSVLGLVVFVLEGLAIPGLFARKTSGWNMLFYANAVNVLSSLFAGDLVGAVLGFVISFYFLFQVKSYYS
jgi:hypothetical protein